jgi:hypothetical protein
MRWTRVAFVTIIPLLAIQPAHAQSGISDPLCEFACWMSPSDAPPSCGCKTAGAGDKPLTEPPATPRPRPSPAPATPTVSNCQVICQKNPLTAPADCDCTVLNQGSGTGTAGIGGVGPAVTPESIVEDGMVTVAELLDYMEQLYRSRIAGVERYQYLERKVVGQSSPLARTGKEPRMIRVANAQLAQNKPVMGVDTMIPGMYFLEKVMREGHEAFKILTPPEINARRADTLTAPRNARPGDLEAGRALMKDPALFFEALGLQGTAGNMRKQFEKEKNDEDLFAEDVLEELLALKKAMDAEATNALLAEDAEQVTKYRNLNVGWVRSGTLKFTQGPLYCKSPLGCTLEEIAGSLPKDLPGNWLTQNVVCLVWTPVDGTFVLTDFALKQGISTKNMGAQLWLPISGKLADYVLAGATESKMMSSEEDIDRPIRALVAFNATTASGSSKLMYWDRVYGDFRTIGKGKGQGPLMNVPHRIREQLRSAPCPDSVDTAQLVKWLALGYFDDADEIDKLLDKFKAGKATPEESCRVAVNKARVYVTDSFREKSQVNMPVPSAAEEARMIYEQFGCIGQPSDDPNSPCSK